MLPYQQVCILQASPAGKIKKKRTDFDEAVQATVLTQIALSSCPCVEVLVVEVSTETVFVTGGVLQEDWHVELCF